MGRSGVFIRKRKLSQKPSAKFYLVKTRLFLIAKETRNKGVVCTQCHYEQTKEFVSKQKGKNGD